jgi:hypothetical protein
MANSSHGRKNAPTISKKKGASTEPIASALTTTGQKKGNDTISSQPSLQNQPLDVSRVTRSGNRAPPLVQQPAFLAVTAAVAAYRNHNYDSSSSEDYAAKPLANTFGRGLKNKLSPIKSYTKSITKPKTKGKNNNTDDDDDNDDNDDDADDDDNADVPDWSAPRKKGCPKGNARKKSLKEIAMTGKRKRNSNKKTRSQYCNFCDSFGHTEKKCLMRHSQDDEDGSIGSAAI